MRETGGKLELSEVVIYDRQTICEKIGKLNTALWDCIGEAETLCDEVKNKNIDDNMRKLFAQYNDDGAVDCDIHNATLSEVSYLIKNMTAEEI